jgi:hypothetical protein
MLPARRTRIVARIALCATFFRAASAVLAFLFNLVFPSVQAPAATLFGRPSPFWDPFTRFDGGWYYQIARYGYLFAPGGPSAGVGKAGKIAYFPVYPLLMRYAGRLFGTSAADVCFGGIAVSWTAFVAAMIALFFLARLDLPPVRAERAVLLTAIFPFSFFFGMIYTESLFLLLTVAAFLAFRTRRPILGGVCGGLASATRVNGILMLPALAWIVWRNTEPALRPRIRAIVGLGLACTGLALYSLYVYRISGNPFEWAASISRWGYHPGGPPWTAPIQLLARLATHPYAYLTTDGMAIYDVLYGLTGLLFVCAIPFVWYRFGTAYGLFMAANLWLPLSSGVFEGVGRYCSVLFPFFIWLAAIRSRAVFVSVLLLSALFYALGLALFTTMHPLF